MLLYEVGESVYCCTCADNVQVGVNFLDKTRQAIFREKIIIKVLVELQPTDFSMTYNLHLAAR